MAPVTANSPRPTATPTPAVAATPAPAPRPADPASTPRPATRPVAGDTFQAATRPANGPVLQPTAPPATETRTTAAEATSPTRLVDPDTASRNGFPWISQLNPNGPAESFVNGDSMCGPASLAMAARKIGFGADLDDQALIEKLAKIGGTKPDTGTSMNGIVAMARAIGLPVDQSEAKFPGFDEKWMDAQLAQGKSIVANGALETPEGPSGHYILVTGKDAKSGKYKVNDPWNESTRELSAQQLSDFLKRNPVHKGASVALG